MSTEVGVAYISILPSASKLADAVKRELTTAQGHADKSGAEAGEKFGDGFSGKAKTALKAGLLGAVVGIGAGLSAGLVGALDFEKAKGKLTASLGLNARESKRLGGVAGSLYADAYGESLGEVTQSVGEIVSAFPSLRNATKKDLEETSKGFLDFASIFDVDIARAASVAGVAVKNGLADTPRAALDQLTVAMQNVPADLREDLLDATEEYGPFFADLGLRGEEAMTLLANASSKGQFGIDKAGDALKEFSLLVQGDMARAKPVIQGLGLDYERTANQLLGGGAGAKRAMTDVIDGLLGIENPAARARASIELFGTPIEDLGLRDVPKFLKSLKGGGKELGNFDGAIKRAGESLNDNASTQLTSFVRTAKLAAVTFVGGTVIPMVRSLVDRFGPGVVRAKNAVVGFFRESVVPAATALRERLRPAFEAVTAAVSAAVGWLSRNRDIVAATVAGVAAAGAALLIYRTYVKVITLATKAWAVAQRILNGSLRANPIGLVITAIGLLVAGLVIAYKRSDTFRAIVDKAWSRIKEVVSSAWKNTIKPALTAFWRFVRNDLMPVIKSLWQNVVKPSFKLIWEAVKLAWTIIKPVLKAWWAYMKNVLFPVMRFLWTNVVKPIFGFIGGTIARTWKNVIRPALDALGNFLNDKLIPAFRNARDRIGDFWEGLKNAAQAPVRFVVETIYNDGLRKMIGLLPGVDTPAPVTLGFASGGYTGPGAKHAPAGIVHRDEFVVRSEARRRFERIFPGALDHLNKFGFLPGFARGGRFGGVGTRGSDVGSTKVSGSASVNRSGLLSVIGQLRDLIGRLNLDRITGPWSSYLIDMIRSVGRSAIGWMNDKIPNRGLPDNPIPTGVFDSGGILPPGGIGLNLSRKPEAVFTHQQFRDLAPKFPSRVTLVVGGRSFDAYVRELADDSIDSAARFTGQRTRMGV